MYMYSAKNNAFYLSDSEELYKAEGTWPDDAKSVSDKIAEEFMAEPPVGKKRIAGRDGYPSWEEIPPPTQEELAAAAVVEKQNRVDQTNAYINSKQWPGKAAIGRLKGDELALYNLWLDYLDALEVVDTTIAPDIKWPTPPASAER
ncbi:tail fiber assembly protein [Escherichia coli]|uniref:tail fiber assembly protein n=1 Tax=Escherichia coli TaxID=562 RepID=UPI00234CF9F8|nr:tail fiber assembly protein [Escherichia coli]MDC6897052.1 tail fiber assembly protein [Escherichia coli]